MADRVQYVLDRMSTVFHQLISLKLFTEEEVTSIINRRRDFEYLIMRRQLVPANYYSYIQYETNLFKLLNIRHHQESDAAMVKQQRHVNALMIRHISYVFERAIRRFPSELDFWMEYIAFLKESKSTNLLNNVLGKAISLNPKTEAFWSMAAMHELQENANAHAARVLLQRGLRVNESSKELWKRYFELELWNALRVVERQKALTNSDAIDESPISIVGVVFKHAIKAIKDVDFAFELHALLVETAPREIVDDVESAMKEVFLGDSHFWQQLTLVYSRKALGLKEDTDISKARKKRKTGESSEENVLLSCVDCVSSIQPFIESSFAALPSNKQQHYQSMCNIISKCLAMIRYKIDSLVSLPARAAVAATASEAEESTRKSKRRKSAKRSSEEEEQETNAVAAETEVTPTLAALQQLESSRFALLSFMESVAKELSENANANAANKEINNLVITGNMLLVRHQNWCVNYLTKLKQSLRTDVSVASNIEEDVRQNTSAIVGWIRSASACVKSASTPAVNGLCRESDLVQHLIGTLSDVVNAGIDSSRWILQVSKSSVVIDNVEEAQALSSNKQALANFVTAELHRSILDQICTAALACADRAIGTEKGSELMFLCIDALNCNGFRDNWENALQSIISSKYCPNEQRSLWCLRYLQYVIGIEEVCSSATESEAAVGSKGDESDEDSSDDESDRKKTASNKQFKPITSVKELYSWLESTMRLHPQYFVVGTMAPYYLPLIECLVSKCPLPAASTIISKKRPTTTTVDSNISFVKAAIERAIAMCPSESQLWDHLESLEKSCGNMQALSNIRWRRSKI